MFNNDFFPTPPEVINAMLQDCIVEGKLLEVFEKLTEHYHENRYNVEGWKTNSHYLVNMKFIMPYLASVDYGGKMGISHSAGSRQELIEDFQKALCYITGRDYDEIGNMWSFFSGKKCEFNTWYEWGFFRVKGFKKGTMHFTFKDQDVWAKFNQQIARIKGYPLFEHTK